MDENETPIQPAKEVKKASKPRTAARKPRVAKTAANSAATPEKPAKKAKTPRTRKTAAPTEPAENTPHETAPASLPVPAETAPAAAPQAPAAESKESTPPVRTRVVRTRRAASNTATEEHPEVQQTPSETPKQAQNEGAQQSARELQQEAEPSRDIAPGFAAPETVGGNESVSNNRRKRRRRNRRGNGETSAFPAPSHLRVDTDELVRRAWKIYLGEVTEEGLALMDDRTAAEASRRAFRVAELFLLEAARHRQPASPAIQPDTVEEEAPSGEE